MKKKTSLKGYTLVEILTAVIIVTVLVTLAVPMYEKTLERTHLGEARTVLDGLQKAKIFAMDKMGIDQYNPDSSPRLPRLEHLNGSFANAANDTCNADGVSSFCTHHFFYSIDPGGVTGNKLNGVCARRLNDDEVKTVLFFYRPNEQQEQIADQFITCKGPLCESAYGLENSVNSSISCI